MKTKARVPTQKEQVGSGLVLVDTWSSYQWLSFNIWKFNPVQVKSEEVFDEWVSKLRHHRMYRQNEIAMFPRDVTHFFPGSSVTDSAPGVFDSVSSRKVMMGLPVVSKSGRAEGPILGVSLREVLWVRHGKLGRYPVSLLISESDSGYS